MIDLSRWNWTSPVGAKVTSTQELARRISNAYITFRADGAITFRAPSSGEGIKSTPNSTYPRSELRETLPNGDDKEANWTPESAPIHVLEAALVIDELPATQKAILGQIHGEGNHPPLKIQVTGDTVYVQLRRKRDGSENKPALGKVKIGDLFSYRIEVYSDWRAKIYFNGKQVVSTTLLEDGYQFDRASYAGDSWYFKAGVYSQEKVGGVGAGQATFIHLDMRHGDVVPPSVPVPVDFNALLDAASKLPRKEMLAELNRVTNLIDDADISDETQAPLYKRIKAMKVAK